MAKSKFSRVLTPAQAERRAENLRRKHERKVAQIDRSMRRAAKHSFDFASKF